MKKVFSAILMLILLLIPIQGIASNDILQTSIKMASDDIIMNGESISAWNSQNDSIYIGYSISRADLIIKINQLSTLPSYKRYIKSKDSPLYEASTSYYNNLIKNIGQQTIQPTNDIKYGVILYRTPLKAWPSIDQAFNSPNSSYDRFLESTLYPFEPIAILHESMDRKWLFIKMYNYEGWIQKEHVAYTSLEVLKLFESNPNFIVISEPKTYMQYSKRELDMGCIFPLVNEREQYYTVLCPQKRSDNSLYFSFGRIDKQDAHKGYSPYTQKNVLKQAEKFINEPYGWGGTNGYRDCSSLVMDIYRSMGIKLKRNTDQQETMYPLHTSLIGMTDLQKSKSINLLPAGGLIFMNGHVMLYVGFIDGVHYILHDTPGFYTNDGYNDANKVTVTNVNIKNSQGFEYLTLFTSTLYITK